MDHGLYYLRTLLDVSTSEESLISTASLKLKVVVKRNECVAFLLRYKLEMLQLDNSGMNDNNGDYM